MATGFEYVIEPYDIALDIHIRVLNRIAHTGLGSQVDHNVEVVFRKQFVNQFTVGNIAFYGFIMDARRFQLIQFIQAVYFQRRILVVVQVVDTYYDSALHLGKQPVHQVAANKPGMTRHQNGLAIKVNLLHILVVFYFSIKLTFNSPLTGSANAASAISQCILKFWQLEEST